MKLKNIVLALKDQMPLSRFWRNLRAGHLKGLLSMRSHLNADGKPKVKYGSKPTAEKAAAAMMKKRGHYYSNYKCLYCDGYHLGRNSSNKETQNGKI